MEGGRAQSGVEMSVPKLGRPAARAEVRVNPRDPVPQSPKGSLADAQDHGIEVDRDDARRGESPEEPGRKGSRPASQVERRESSREPSLEDVEHRIEPALAVRVEALLLLVPPRQPLRVVQFGSLSRHLLRNATANYKAADRRARVSACLGVCDFLRRSTLYRAIRLCSRNPALSYTLRALSLSASTIRYITGNPAARACPIAARTSRSPMPRLWKSGWTCSSFSSAHFVTPRSNHAGSNAGPHRTNPTARPPTSATVSCPPPKWTALSTKNIG